MNGSCSTETNGTSVHSSEPSIVSKKQYSVCGLFVTSEEKHIENPFKIFINVGQLFVSVK